MRLDAAMQIVIAQHGSDRLILASDLGIRNLLVKEDSSKAYWLRRIKSFLGEIIPSLPRGIDHPNQLAQCIVLKGTRRTKSAKAS